MRIPVIRGLIRRRLLLNFRAKPEVVQRIVPQPFWGYGGRWARDLPLLSSEQLWLSADD